MEKRVFIFIAISLSILFAYNKYFAPKIPEKLPEQISRPAVTSGTLKPEPSSLKAAPEGVLAEPEQKVEKIEGKDVVVETDLYRIVLTTSGARIKSFRLKKYKEAKVKKEVLEKNLARIEASLRREQKPGERKKLTRERDRLQYLIKRKPVPGEGVELVPFDGDFYGHYPLTLSLPALDKKGRLNAALYGVNRESLKLGEGRDTGSIEFRYLTPEGIEIIKKLRFSLGSYLIGVEISVRNNSSRAINEENFLVSYGPGIGLLKKTQVRSRQVSPFATWVNGKVLRDIAGREIGKGFIKKTTMKWGQFLIHPGPVGWTALRNAYFVVALIPKETAGAQLLDNEDETRKIALKMPPFSLAPGQDISEKLSLYLGPQDMAVLRKSGSHLEAIIDFGFWSWIAKPIYALLKIFDKWLGNYGLSIILLSFVIKLVFYPFTHKSFEAMKNMQEGMKAIQPEMEALKEKHKDNPQKLNKATMALYKKRGVNPLGGCKGGCLPMLFQTPVFFALYAVLYNTIELRQAPFIHGWINDLSAPDPYFILPVLMGGTMYLQQKLTGMGGSGGAQPDQAKMMSIMMPAVLTFIFFRLPAGVVLYWLCFNVFTSLQQLLIKKKSEAKAKAKA
ncbi:MAG: membrane protein insertase YidC [Nitrospirae bacterium]|nr:membrane protein insertase YidC [Nitrospirota bacterium]